VELEPGDAQKGAQVTGYYTLLRDAIYWWVDSPPALQFGVPLITFLSSSLLLVGLKRASGLPLWLQRVVAPPFYLISLPLATLIIGSELLASAAPGVHRLALMSTSFLLFMPLSLLIWLLCEPLAALTGANLLIAPFVVFVGSGFMLWRTVGQEKERGPVLSEARQKHRAFLLPIVFAWAFLTSSEFLLRASGRP
jgi:hypothetical protein